MESFLKVSWLARKWKFFESFRLAKKWILFFESFGVSKKMESPLNVSWLARKWKFFEKNGIFFESFVVGKKMKIFE
jgi:hypothetical protein